jgi:hypothetical protein
MALNWYALKIRQVWILFSLMRAKGMFMNLLETAPITGVTLRTVGRWQRNILKYIFLAVIFFLVILQFVLQTTAAQTDILLVQM